MAETVFDDPLRHRILDAVCSALSQIQTANGYKFDIPLSSTFWGRDSFGEKDPVPLLSVLEVPIPLDLTPTAPDSPYAHGWWDLFVQGFIDKGDEPSCRKAHRLMADVKFRLAKEKFDNGRKHRFFGFESAISDMRVGAGVVRPADRTSAFDFFWLDLSLEISEDLLKPYTDR